MEVAKLKGIMATEARFVRLGIAVEQINPVKAKEYFAVALELRKQIQENVCKN